VVRARSGASPFAGFIEGFMRNLKEECLWLQRFENPPHHRHCTPRTGPAAMRAAV